MKPIDKLEKLAINFVKCKTKEEKMKSLNHALCFIYDTVDDGKRVKPYEAMKKYIRYYNLKIEQYENHETIQSGQALPKSRRD